MPVIARTLGNVCAVALVLLAYVSAGAQPLVPLPRDKHIRVYIGVWDRFYSPYHKASRYLQLTANVAAYHPVEQPRVQTFDERRILTLQVPDQGGWAHFYADEDTIKLVFRVEDRRNRLGKLRLMAFGKGLLVGELSADRSGSRIAGSLRYDSDQQYYLAYLFSKRGEVLAKLLIDRGWWDAVVPVVISREFLPYRPAPPSDERIRKVVGAEDFPGEDGDWGQLNPPPRFAPYPSGASASTLLVQEFTNDNFRTAEVLPPAHAGTFKRWNLLNIRILGSPKIREEWLKQYVQSQMDEMRQTAQVKEPMLEPVKVPPYAQGFAYWHVWLRGIAKAVLWLPEERSGRGKDINPLLDRIQQQLHTERDWLSEASARIANRLLQDKSLQLKTGLKPGDVLPGENVYTVHTDAVAGYHADNLIQTFRLRAYAQYPDGSREPIEATVVVSRKEAFTDPYPPLAFSPSPQLRVGKDGVEIALGKGWVYELWIDGHPEQKTTIEVPSETPEIWAMQYRDTKPSVQGSVH